MSLRSHAGVPARPATVSSLRLWSRCGSPAEFCQRHWRLVKDDRILLASRAARPAGSRLRFSIALADGREVLRGEGTVVQQRPLSTGSTCLEVVFSPLDPASASQLEVLHALRAAHGPADHGDSAPLDFEEEVPTARKITPLEPEPLPPPPPGPDPRAPRIPDSADADWDDQFMADPVAVWQTLPTGRIVKIFQGVLDVAAAEGAPLVEARRRVIIEEPPPHLDPLPRTATTELPPAPLERRRLSARVAILLLVLGLGGAFALAVTAIFR